MLKHSKEQNFGEGMAQLGKHQTLSLFLVKKPEKNLFYSLCERKALTTGIKIKYCIDIWVKQKSG